MYTIEVNISLYAQEVAICSSISETTCETWILVFIGARTGTASPVLAGPLFQVAEPKLHPSSADPKVTAIVGALHCAECFKLLRLMSSRLYVIQETLASAYIQITNVPNQNFVTLPHPPTRSVLTFYCIHHFEPVYHSPCVDTNYIPFNFDICL